MTEFVTRLSMGDEKTAITWQLQLKVTDKKALHAGKAWTLTPGGYVVDNCGCMDILLARGCVTGWSREDELTEEAVFDIPYCHIDALTTMVADYILTGVHPQAEEGADPL